MGNKNQCCGRQPQDIQSVPKKSRSRTCIPEAYGGRNCSHLEDQARRNNELLDKEVQECSDLPSCPRPATLGSWGDWSACAQTCFSVGRPLPQREKRRSCNEALLSTNQTLNTGVVTCKDLEDVKYKNCNILACPVDATWSSWPSDWSSCSGICKKRGEPVPKKSRSRTCVQEAYGGKNCSFLEEQTRMNQQPLYREEQTCSELPDCPRPAIMGSWGEWSACSQTCFSVDQPMPQVERNRSCSESILSADKKWIISISLLV